MLLSSRSWFLVLSLAALSTNTVAQQGASSYSMTSGRLVATSAAVAGLVGVLVGVVSMFRPRRFGGFAALALGVIALLVGAFAAVSSGGQIGTGGGLAGAIVAIVLGAIAIVLGGIAMRRSRQAE